MRAFVTDARGETWALPIPTAWRMEYTAGVPCDSFEFRCPWELGSGADPARWVTFFAQWEGERVFTGVVDECVVTLSANGRELEISGRGMAARLLDNEALGQDYGVATLADILRDHVTPYGIAVAPGADLPAVPRFSVEVGSSEWSVVRDFALYHGGVSPRFDRWGRLVLTGWEGGQELLLGNAAPVTELVCRDKRYGVLSHVLMRDRFHGAVERVDNGDFLADGGMARRVITMPGRSDGASMRYSGQFQLKRSAADLERLEVTVALPFCAWPGDRVYLQRDGWERSGMYRVAAATVTADGKGIRTRLELAPPDFVE